MMDRDTIERIVSSLPTGKLISALRHVGVSVGPGGDPGISTEPVSMAPIEDDLAGWRETLVQVPATKRGPIVNTAPLVEPVQPASMLGPDPISAMSSADVTPWAAAISG